MLELIAKTFAEHGAEEGDEDAPRQRNPDHQWPHKPVHRLFLVRSGGFVNPAARRSDGVGNRESATGALGSP